MGIRQRAALERLWPAYGVPVTDRPLDPVALFGCGLPVVLEIGSGMGEATATMAAADPDSLSAPEHRPLTRFEQRGIEAGRAAYDLMFRRIQDCAGTGRFHDRREGGSSR
jgi:tRNA (guanine-N7-)-methyltransferase